VVSSSACDLRCLSDESVNLSYYRVGRGYPFDCPALLASVEALRLPPRLVGGR